MYLKGGSGLANIVNEFLAADATSRENFNLRWRAINEKVAEKTQVKTATLSTTWTGTGPFTQVLTITGVTASNNLEVGLAQTATKVQIETAGSAMLMATAQGTNSITVTAYGEKPIVVIPLQILILG